MAAPVKPESIPGAGFSYPPDQVPVTTVPAPAAVAAPAPVSVAAPAPTTLGGDTVPPELQGKTLDEAMTIYRTLRSEHLSRFNAPAPPPVREVAAAQPVPQTDPATFWTSPEASIDAIVERRVAAALAPLTANSQATAARSARDQVAQRFGPGYVALEHKVLEKLQNLDANLLADPNAWANAYYLAAGEASVTGSPVAPPPAALPVVSTAPRLNPTFLPTTASIFTEPSRSAQTVVGADSLSQAELVVAQKMGMSAESYASWKGGRPRG